MGVVFLIVLAIHLFAIVVNDDTLAMVTKPMLMIALLMLFFDKARKAVPKIKIYVFGALVFSLAGDVLLMFQQQDGRFFIFGLSAFLIAHVFYILYFRGAKKLNQATGSFSKTIAADLSVVYAIALLWVLFPRLGSMKIPVLVYGIVISLMLVSAIRAYVNLRSRFAILSILGAVLFVASDSLLAINKFHTPFADAGWMIMLTYGLAQFFIVWGSILNLKPVSE